jgi:hypothetical protein
MAGALKHARVENNGPDLSSGGSSEISASGHSADPTTSPELPGKSLALDRLAQEPRIELAQAQPAQGVSPPRPAPAAQAPAAPSQEAAPARQRAQIDRNNLIFLIRSTLMALHHANETGNYSVLREMSAPGFQAANNQARLAEVFANLRAQKLDLSAVSILEPQITATPTIDANNLLLIDGGYPQIPPQGRVPASLPTRRRTLAPSGYLDQSGPGRRDTAAICRKPRPHPGRRSAARSRCPGDSAVGSPAGSGRRPAERATSSPAVAAVPQPHSGSPTRHRREA